VSDVTLDVPPGTVVAITGGNGTGKSTLLRIMAGLSRPTLGTVTGRPTLVGYVPDRFPPNERMSAIEYLTHMGRIRGLGTKEAVDRAAALLESLFLVGEEEDAPIRNLSKGNAQKVVLAQALMVRPRLLVLDEPWSGLHTAVHGILAEIIDELASDGGAVVFTDHRESITRAYASTTYSLDAARSHRLEEVEGAIVVADVVLHEPESPPSTEWSTLPGVLEVLTDGETTTVRVLREESDALLMIALKEGWSVQAVRSLLAAPGELPASNEVPAAEAAEATEATVEPA
jgi:ABC-type Mn2+/Zn2+ transport system ATPase subunit